MPFEKGHGLSTGRPKGSKNKIESITKRAIREVIEGNLKKLADELEKLEGKPFLDAYLSMMEFTEAKLSRTEIVGDEEQPLSIDLTQLDDKTLAKLAKLADEGEDMGGAV